MHHKTIVVEKEADQASRESDFCRAQDIMCHDTVVLPTDATIQQAMGLFCRQYTSNLMVIAKKSDPRPAGRICVKDVLYILFPGLLRKDLILLNHSLHESIERILLPSSQKITPVSDIKQILAVMLRESTQAIGVEQDDKYVGLITSIDLLNMTKDIDNPESPLSIRLKHVSLKKTRVSEIMTHRILCLSPQDEISRAVCMFLATPMIHNIPILNNKGKMEGILSQMDLLKYTEGLFESKNLKVFENKGLILDRAIHSMILSNTTTIPSNAHLAEAAKMMFDIQSTCLVVNDNQQNFCGILSCTDIFRWLHDHLSQ